MIKPLFLWDETTKRTRHSIRLLSIFASEPNQLHTDEFCVRRFFGAAEVEIIGITSDGSKKIGTVGRIRTQEEPNVGEFLTYLTDVTQRVDVKPGKIWA